MSALGLPPELLRMVFEHLPKPDLKEVRQICKAFAATANAKLFDTVYVAPNYADMETADQVCSRYKCYIQTMVYCPTRFVVDTSFKGFFEWRYDQVFSRKGNPRLVRLWNLYRTLFDEYFAFVESGEFRAQFCHLLRTSVNLRKVILTDTFRSSAKDCECRRVALGAGNRQKNPIADVASIIQKESRYGDHRCVENAFHLGSRNDNPWPFLLDALATTHASVREICIDITDSIGSSRGLRMDALLGGPFNTLSGLQSLSQAMSSLSSLLLRLDPLFPHAPAGQPLPDFSTILSLTINLKVLEIYIVDEDSLHSQWRQNLNQNIFLAITGSCTFPRLETFALRYVDETTTQFLRFLQGFTCLKCLTLEGI